MMKKLVFILTVLLTMQTYAQRKPKIKGNRSVVEVTEQLPSFKALVLEDDLEITLRKADTEEVFLTADDNLIDVLKFDVENEVLTISSFYEITGKKKLDITVNFRELESITIQEGQLRTKDIIGSEELRISAYGQAKMELNANAPVIDLVMEGNSSGDLNLDGDSLNIVLKDRIDVRIYSVSNRHTLKMYGTAAARMEGTADDLQVQLFDSANLKGEMLEATRVQAILEGSSDGRFHAMETFSLDARGSSKTELYGDAEIEILDFLDTAQLQKEE